MRVNSPTALASRISVGAAEERPDGLGIADY
jgi:hypothetical protein